MENLTIGSILEDMDIYETDDGYEVIDMHLCQYCKSDLTEDNALDEVGNCANCGR